MKLLEHKILLSLLVKDDFFTDMDLCDINPNVKRYHKEIKECLF